MATICTTCLTLALLAPALLAQTQPDFTGRWRLVSAAGVLDGWDVASAMTIRQVIGDGRTAAGAPMRPYLQALQVERTTDTGIWTETITVGIRGGVVGGIAASGKSPRSLSESAVEWRGDALLIWQRTTISDGDMERASERAHEWSLDGERQLVIALRTREPGQESRRGRLVYRRVE